MRNDRILKTIIILFAAVLVILSTFVYGNIQRAKQKTASNSNKAVVVPSSNDSSAKLPNSENKPTSLPPATTPATTAVVPTTQPNAAKTPATGSSDAVLPMTIISGLGYIYITKSKKTRQQAFSKSRTY